MRLATVGGMKMSPKIQIEPAKPSLPNATDASASAPRSQNRLARWWANLSDSIRAVIFGGVAIVIATIVLSGFFTVVSSPDGGIYVVNKYTGGVTYCRVKICVNAGPPTP